MCVFTALAGGTVLTYFSVQGYNSSVLDVDWGWNRQSALVNLSLMSQLIPFKAMRPSVFSSLLSTRNEPTYHIRIECVSLRIPSRVSTGYIGIRSRTIPAKRERSRSICVAGDQVPIQFCILWSSPRLTCVLKPNSETIHTRNFAPVGLADDSHGSSR